MELHHQTACRGWRWINHHTIDEATEREHARLGLGLSPSNS